MKPTIDRKIAEERGWGGFHVELADAQIYVEQHGAGDPLVCLHNFSANARSRFNPLLPLLSKHYTCFLVDLRGHGRSSNASDRWDHALISEDIAAVCKALGLETSRFLATSSGAMAMLRVARNSPGLVEAMVLDSGTYRVPETARKYYKDPATLSHRLREYYSVANEIEGPEAGFRLAGIFHDFRLPECDINQPLDHLREIAAPTLLIAGDRDMFFPVDIPIAMKQTIRRSELFVQPRTGHIVMEFFPELVADLTVQFFRRFAERPEQPIS